MAALFRLGQTAGVKAKCITLQGLLLKPSQADVSASHSARGQLWGSQSDLHIPEKSRFQLAGQNVEQLL